MSEDIQKQQYYLFNRKINRNRTNVTVHKNKKRKRKVPRFKVILLILMMLFMIIFVCKYSNKESDKYSENRVDTLELSGEVNTDSKKMKIYESLKKLAENNSDYNEIFQRRDEYPIELLNGLIHNNEMLNFVKGYFDADKNTTDSFTTKELNEKNPLFIQWDKRWGYKNYGDSIMGVSGCGPTSLSMAIVALTGNDKATPFNVAKFSHDNGYYTSGKGSSWNLITQGAKHYGIKAKTLSLSKSSLTNALDEGSILILAMGPGKFTSSGHFIVIYGYNKTGFYINDSNSYERSKKIWPFSEFSDEIQNIWALSKK